MNEEERNAFEKNAPTYHSHLHPVKTSWDKEFLLAACCGDIPRMARALEQGANPKVTGENANSAAHQYALGINLTLNENMRPRFHATDIENAWVWLKARGVPLHQRRIDSESAWDMLYKNHDALAYPLDAQCTEVNLWALWKQLSYQERHDILLHLDARFAMDEICFYVQSLPALENTSPFSSRVMRDTLALKGIDCTVRGKVVPELHLQHQDRLLALSSLLKAQQGTHLERHVGFVKDSLLLGLWAYAPASVLHDLTSLPSYRPLLCECLLQNVATFHQIHRPYPDGSMDEFPGILARRLARGVRTLLQTGLALSPEEKQALMTINEVRPFLERALLKETLENKHQGICSETTPPLRPRL